MSDKPIIDELTITPVDDVPTPRRTVSTGRTTRTSKAAPPYKEGALIEPLRKAYAAFGLGLMAFSPQTALAVAENAESCALAWDEWAKTSPAVRKLLYPLLNVSGGAKVLAAHLPILLAVVAEKMEGTNLAAQVERYLQGFAVQPMDETE